MREQGDRNGHATGVWSGCPPLGTYEVPSHARGLCLAGAGTGELLSAREGEVSSNVAALTEWLWREPGKSSRHPCSLCPLADRSLARSHPPGNYGSGARQSKRRLPGCLWKGDLNSPLMSHSAAFSQLGCQCPHTVALSCLGRQRGRPRNWGLGQSSGPLP